MLKLRLTGRVMTVLLILALLYFIPAIVAVSRQHSQAVGITLLNVFLGWTLIGWVIAIVWAAQNERKPTTAPAVALVKVPETQRTNSDDAADIERFARLRDDGVISAEEFEAKKRQILG